MVIAMKPFSHFSPGQAARVRYVLADIDDTLTTGGKLPAAAYAALWRLHDAGYRVIPVTGRPAGWCDLIIRQWPVDAVVGENGAFVCHFSGGQLRTLVHPSVATGDIQGRLEAVKEACLSGVPGCRVARDQFSRIYDLAIDFCEDPPRLSLEEAERVCAICRSMGANAKVSSIHVNTWFGDYDKLAASLLFLEQTLGEADPAATVLYFGDSPNDEPMFAHFPNSCGVANIRPFVSHMRSLPAYVTAQSGGQGFAEAVEHLLSL